MKTHKLKQQSGFTIIEVLIVLAIAGLIMLIVFLAVPALQRNSRNTQTRKDVAAIVGATTEFMSNHTGAVPTSTGGDSNAPGTDANTILKDSNARAITKIVIVPSYAGSVNYSLIQFANGGVDAAGVALIVTGVRCDTSSGLKTVAASAKSIAVLFSIETSGNDRAAQCVEG